MPGTMDWTTYTLHFKGNLVSNWRHNSHSCTFNHRKQIGNRSSTSVKIRSEWLEVANATQLTSESSPYCHNLLSHKQARNSCRCCREAPSTPWTTKWREWTIWNCFSRISTQNVHVNKLAIHDHQLNLRYQGHIIIAFQFNLEEY